MRDQSSPNINPLRAAFAKEFPDILIFARANTKTRCAEQSLRSRKKRQTIGPRKRTGQGCIKLRKKS